MTETFSANENAARLLARLEPDAKRLRIRFLENGTGVDFGVEVPGGLDAGLMLARISMGGLGRVRLVSESIGGFRPRLSVQVRTDQPLVACMGCQYGGWQVKSEKWFAIGSGPMRLLRGREPVLEKYGLRDEAPIAVGVLESASLPSPQVAAQMAGECDRSAGNIRLCVAPTRSLAGTIQIVARSVEATMHKLHELGADLRRVISGWGSAPLPPVSADDMTAIGRTNDAILYGGRVRLWVDMDDREIAELGPRIPACASPDFGRPFAEIFRAAGGDFYRLDPMLFSAAEVTLAGMRSGNEHVFGRTVPELVP